MAARTGLNKADRHHLDRFLASFAPISHACIEIGSMHERSRTDATFSHFVLRNKPFWKQPRLDASEWGCRIIVVWRRRKKANAIQLQKRLHFLRESLFDNCL